MTGTGRDRGDTPQPQASTPGRPNSGPGEDGNPCEKNQSRVPISRLGGYSGKRTMGHAETTGRSISAFATGRGLRPDASLCSLAA